MSKLSYVEQNRVDNLELIRQQTFGGSINSLAKHIGKTEKTVYEYLSKGFSGKIARKIENQLELEMKSLDIRNDKHLQVFFIHINVAFEPKEIIRKLRKYNIIKLACIVSGGDYNVLIKVESTPEEYEELILDTIPLISGVNKTHTSTVIKNQLWQRKQDEIEPHAKKESYIEEICRRKLINLKARINHLESGSMMMSFNANDDDYPKGMGALESANKSFDITTRWQKETEDEHNNIQNKESKPYTNKEYLNKHKDVVESGVKIKRIFLISHKIMDGQILTDIYDTAQMFLKIGVEVKVLNEKNWISTSRHIGAEGFYISDKATLIIKKRGNVKVSRDKSIVKEYSNIFMSNWNKALSPEDYFS